MSRGINKVILVGHLGADPETRYTQSGTAVTEISIATSEAWKDRNGELQERTEWHRVTLWGRLGEIAGEYLRKGSQVYIEGSLRTEKYTDKNDVERYTTKVNASDMQMLGSAGGGQRDSGGSRGGDRQRGGQGGGRQQSRPQDRHTKLDQRGSYNGGYGGGQANSQAGGREFGSRSGEQQPAGGDFQDDDIPF